MKNIRRYIARQLFDLQQLEYDHDGLGSLPARADAVNLAMGMFCSTRSRGLPLDFLEEPVVSLEGDGTIEVTFLQGAASVVFRFLCASHLIIERHLGDSVTTSKHHSHRGGDVLLGDAKQAISWLATHTVSVEGR